MRTEKEILSAIDRVERGTLSGSTEEIVMQDLRRQLAKVRRAKELVTYTIIYKSMEQFNVCDGCGAMVYDRDQHAEFHVELKKAQHDAEFSSSMLRPIG